MIRQGRAGQGRAGQGRAGQGRAGQGRAGQGRAGQGRAGQGRAGQGRAGQGRAGQGRAGQGRAGQGKAKEMGMGIGREIGDGGGRVGGDGVRKWGSLGGCFTGVGAEVGGTEVWFVWFTRKNYNRWKTWRNTVLVGLHSVILPQQLDGYPPFRMQDTSCTKRQSSGPARATATL